MTKPRVILASCSVAIMVVVITIGAALGPDAARTWLLFSGLVAFVAAMQSVASDPADLTPALLFSLPPVIALVADGSPTSLIGPLGALLLLAAELNALSWKCQGTDSMSAGKRRPLLNTVQLTLLGLAGSLGVGVVATDPSPGGTVAVVVAASALAVLGRIVFRRGT